MKIGPIIAALIWSSALLAYEKYPATYAEILASDATEMARNAVERGDRRLLMVPDCFTGIPAYQSPTPPAERPMVLWKSCEELLGSETNLRLEALRNWAEEYNAYIQSQ